MKILKIILGTVLGLALWVLLYRLLSMGITYLFKIPVIGPVLAFPKGISWALVLIPTLISVQSGAMLSLKISDTALPMAMIVIGDYGWRLISMLMSRSFSWSLLLTAVFMIGPAVVATSYGSLGRARNRKKEK